MTFYCRNNLIIATIKTNLRAGHKRALPIVTIFMSCCWKKRLDRSQPGEVAVWSHYNDRNDYFVSSRAVLIVVLSRHRPPSRSLSVTCPSWIKRSCVIETNAFHYVQIIAGHKWSQRSRVVWPPWWRTCSQVIAWFTCCSAGLRTWGKYNCWAGVTYCYHSTQELRL